MLFNSVYLSIVKLQMHINVCWLKTFLQVTKKLSLGLYTHRVESEAHEGQTLTAVESREDQEYLESQ